MGPVPISRHRWSVRTEQESIFATCTVVSNLVINGKYSHENFWFSVNKTSIKRHFDFTSRRYISVRPGRKRFRALKV